MQISMHGMPMGLQWFEVEGRAAKQASCMGRIYTYTPAGRYRCIDSLDAGMGAA